MEFEAFLMFSEKGKQLLVVDKFKFYVNHVSKTNVFTWRCTSKSCKSKVYTENKSTDIIINKSDFKHNHPQDVTLLRQEVSNACKRKAVVCVMEKPSKIIRSELINHDNEAEFTTKDLELVRRNLYNAKLSCFPQQPKSMEEVHEVLETLRNEGKIVTSRKEQFLFINDCVNKEIVFTCKSNLQLLSELDKIYMDGTFEYCAKYFTQFYTIHGFKNSVYIPLVFCLLPNKSQNTYIHLLTELKNAGLNPSTFVVDFEKAMHNAIKIVFPHSLIKGCNFHLGQAWFRKIQQLGLATLFSSANSEIGKWLVHVFGLSFLEPNEVENCFVEYFMATKPVDERITQFCDYLVDYYISEGSDFPPTMWASASASLTKSTNACESFHSSFNSNFYFHHPTIFVFLEVLKQFQVNTYIKIRSANNNVTPRKNAKSVIKQKYLEDQLVKYRSNIISQSEFVKNVSYRNKPKKN